MVRIATNRAISQQRMAHWLETHNGIRDRLRPLAYEIFSYGWSKVQPDWKGILQNRKMDLIKQVRTEPDLWERINVSVSVASVSPNSFTFTIDPGHMLYPATDRKPNRFESFNSLAPT